MLLKKQQRKADRKRKKEAKKAVLKGVERQTEEDGLVGIGGGAEQQDPTGE